MQNFRYTAVDSAGKTVRGKMSAQNELDLEDRLNQQSLAIIEYRAIKQSVILGKTKVSTKDMIMLCVHLEQLDRAGVPILDSLADIRDSADSTTFKNVITDIYENVRNGDLLSQAMKKQSNIFDNVFIGLVAAGEKTGNMSESFAHLSHHLKWNDDLRRSVKKAMMYPIILLIVMSAVIVMMMMFVVPQLTDFLTSQGFELPWYTTLLIDTSDLFVAYWWAVFGGPLITIILCVIIYKKSRSFHYFVDKMILKLPAIGPVARKINLARFSHFFSITFTSGIGVLDCLMTSKDVVENYVMKDSVQKIVQNVSDGSTITKAIAETGDFPGLVVRMFKVGEDSGNMEEALNNINFFYDREVEDSVNSMIQVIQPTLTVVIGGIMFWIIAAVFGPLYASFENMDF